MIRRLDTPLTLLLFILPSFSHIRNLDEPRPVQNQPLEDSPLVYYEALNFPAEDFRQSRVDILYRISHNFFIFVKNEKFILPTDTPNDLSRFPFVGRCLITVEILNKAGISVAREITQREIGTNNPERDANKAEFLQGIVSFTLPPAEYTIVFQVNDRESNQEFLDKSKTVHLRAFDKEPMTISDVLFIEPRQQQSELIDFIPVNLGGNVFFGKNFDAYVEIARTDSHWERLHLAYSLYRLKESPEEDTVYFIRDSVDTDAFTAAKTLVVLRAGTPHTAAYRWQETARSIPKRGMLLPLEGEKLRQGRYELKMTASDGTNRRTHIHRFRVEWVNMPRSLRDFEFAVTVLEHIASKEEYSDLKSPYGRNRREKFEEFWKKKDPTPNTAFNEAMAEYYRRVDYSMENFGNKGEGWKSDRGKTYILYGTPSNTERKFFPAAPPQEIWTYDNLKRRFIFVDEHRNGNYKLVATEHIP